MVGRLCAMISLVIPGYLIVVMADGSARSKCSRPSCACGLSFAACSSTCRTPSRPELTDILCSF
jgi:hypothetical protein